MHKMQHYFLDLDMYTCILYTKTLSRKMVLRGKGKEGISRLSDKSREREM